MDVYKDRANNAVRVVIDHANEHDRELVGVMRVGYQALLDRPQILNILPNLKQLAASALLDEKAPKPLDKRAQRVIRTIDDDIEEGVATTEFKKNKAVMAYYLVLLGISRMTDRRRADELTDHIVDHS